MKQLKLHYKVEAEVQYTRREVALLIKLAKQHYDSKCREAGYKVGEKIRCGIGSYPAERNGFLVQLRMFPGRVLWDLPRFDLTLKVLEMLPCLRDPCELALANRLVRDINAAVEAMTRRYIELN